MPRSRNKCGKSKVMGISRHLTSVKIVIERNNCRMWNISTVWQLENEEYFNCLYSMITNDARCTREIRRRTVMTKEAFNKKKALFSSKLDLNFRKKLVKICTMLKLRQFRKWIGNTKKLMKFGSGEECRRSVGTIEWEMKLQRVKRDRNKLQTIKWGNANWFGHIWRRNCLLKHAIDGHIDGRMKWREDDEEDLSSYWITFRKREGTVNWKRQHYIIFGRRYYGPVSKADNRICSDRLIPGVPVCCLRDRKWML